MLRWVALISILGMLLSGFLASCGRSLSLISQRERKEAGMFCLRDENPRSETAGSDICLPGDPGNTQVTLLFFGLLG